MHQEYPVKIRVPNYTMEQTLPAKNHSTARCCGQRPHGPHPGHTGKIIRKQKHPMSNLNMYLLLSHLISLPHVSTLIDAESMSPHKTSDSRWFRDQPSSPDRYVHSSQLQQCRKFHRRKQQARALPLHPFTGHQETQPRHVC